MKVSTYSSSPHRKTRLSPFFFTLLAFIVFVAIIYGQLKQPIYELRLNSEQQKPSKTTEKDAKRLPFTVGKVIGESRDEGELEEEEEEECDVFSGRWVRDESNRPMYEEWECPYIQPQLTCQEHGRPEKEYQHWRWQPHGCSLPKLVRL